MPAVEAFSLFDMCLFGCSSRSAGMSSNQVCNGNRPRHWKFESIYKFSLVLIELVHACMCVMQSCLRH